MNLPLSPSLAMDLFFVSLTILSAYIVTKIARALIRLPENVDNRRQETFVSVLKSTASVIVYAIALHVIFGILDIDITPLVASVGIVGLAVGMGARPLIEDLIGGLTLLSQEAIAIGDDVEIDGSRGRIEKIGFRVLQIRAKDGSLHIIPNGMVKKVINHSRRKAESGKTHSKTKHS